MKINFKSPKFWIIFSVIVAVIVAITITVIWYCSISAKIDKPENLKCQKLSNGEIYIQVDENSRAKAYEFLITKNNSNQQTIKSSTSILNVTSYLSDIGEFAISCRILGDVESANSDYCDDILFKNNIRISTPDVQLNKEEMRLYFTLQDNYSFDVAIQPTLIYGVNLGGEILTNVDGLTIISNNSRGAISGYFDLSFLNNEEYSVSVKLITQDDFVLSSLASKQFVFKKIN